jgi:4-amino-4-deoxy-L-arabinose transferase-like glycosyltransferase
MADRQLSREPAPQSRSVRATARTLTCVLVFLVTFGVLSYRIVRVGGFHDPPHGGDERDYEALSYNLWKGRGFGFFWSDPDWRAPYLRVPEAAGAVQGLESGYYPTTYRPPAFPMLWAVTHAIAGRDFGLIRLVNAALMAGAVACAAAVALQFAGVAAALLTTVLLLQTPDVTLFARERQAEPLATFLVSLLVWLWVLNSQRPPSIRAAVASGTVLGLLMLSRSIFVLWLPFAAFMPTGKAVPDGAARWRVRACGVLVCLLVVAPWWVRNVVVTGAFLPTGSQGHINLPAGFSQRALDNEGRWRSNPDDGALALETSGVDPYSLEYEVRLAQHRFSLAVAWMRAHPADVLRLMGLHVWQELRTRRDRTDWTLLVPAVLVALAVLRRHRGARAVAVALTAMVVSVALTWGSIGKFILPVLPTVVATIAAAVIAVAAPLFGPVARGVRRRV